MSGSLDQSDSHPATAMAKIDGPPEDLVAR